MNLVVNKDAILNNMFWTLVHSRRTELTPNVIFETKGEVATGPFKGMKVMLQSSWQDGDIMSKLLGIYEEELHSTLYDFSQKQYDGVVNVGCAEGYYAVGLSRLFPETSAYAYDLNPAAQEITKMAANANGRAGQMFVNGACSPEELTRLNSIHRRLLCVIDCEGYELDLLNQTTIETTLRHSDIIVECHDCSRPGITQALLQRFAATHNITNILAGGGSRNLSSFSFLKQLSDLDRAILSCELRPCVMNWLICEAKER